MLRKGLFLADRYEILEQVGTGGMSDVYKAKCHKLNRYVAIKVLKKEFSEDKTFVSKFRAEAQSAAGLAHPNIVNVYDVGDEDGIYYIVMELVEGITLKKYIEKRGKLPYKEAVSIAIQVAKGMEAAHSHHIIHRDIKPQNIIISRDGKVKVTDFGIAKAATSSTINSSAMGSVHYISPEQARGGYSDERSDIYSFGITLYEMITGKVPFDGDTTVAVAVQHMNEEIPSPSSVVEDVPVSVDKIIMKATQKKTDMRYQSITELVDDLKKSLVMPDVDFVKIASVYAVGKGTIAGASAEGKAASASKSMAGSSHSSAKTSSKDDFDEENGDVNDLLIDDDEDDDDVVVAAPRRKSHSDKNSQLSYDEDEEGDDRIDMMFKVVGGIIGALIIIITIVLAVKTFGGGGKDNKPSESAESTTISQEQSSGSASNTVEQVEVPTLVGLTEQEAKNRLNERGLGYKVSNQASQTVEAGYIMAQDIQAGTMVDKNSTIILTISIGPESVILPNIVGYAQSTAIEVLEGMGLTVSEIIEEFSNDYEAGKVVRLDPEVGSQVAPGGNVTVVVSKGKEKVTVPNLIGLTEENAIKLLESQGLKAEVVEVQDETSPYGQVVGQGYNPEESVEVDTVIKIHVNKYKQTETETPTEEPSTEVTTQAPSTEAPAQSEAATAE